MMLHDLKIVILTSHSYYCMNDIRYRDDVNKHNVQILCASVTHLTMFITQKHAAEIH